MSLRALWRYLAIALPVLASVLAPMSTVDLTYHLRAGREILATGAIPTVDTWTFTAAGTPWFDQQWGAQVVLRLVEVVGSWTGLVLLRAALTGTIVGALFLIAHRRGLDVRRAAVLALGAFVVAAPAMALRPQLLGMACFALTLLAVKDRRRSPRAVWIVPLVTAIWANLHGSFFLAPLVLGLAWLEDVHDHRPTARSTLTAGLVSVVAACLTPFGPTVWSYVAGLSSNPEVTSQVTEWQPTSLHDAPGILFFGSALVVALFLARRGRLAPWPHSSGSAPSSRSAHLPSAGSPGGRSRRSRRSCYSWSLAPSRLASTRRSCDESTPSSPPRWPSRASPCFPSGGHWTPGRARRWDR